MTVTSGTQELNWYSAQKFGGFTAWEVNNTGQPRNIDDRAGGSPWGSEPEEPGAAGQQLDLLETVTLRKYPLASGALDQGRREGP